jgi:hypothetical protein
MPFTRAGFEQGTANLGDGVQELLDTLRSQGSAYAGGLSHDVRIEPRRSAGLASLGPGAGRQPPTIQPIGEPSNTKEWLKANWLPAGIVALVVIVAVSAR